jgi:Cyclic nucleotide-binding domain/Major Facilitator Superfamily
VTVAGTIGAVTDGRMRQAAAAIRDTWRLPNLRRAQLSFGAAFAAEWALTVGLGILAFREGGATAVGVVAMGRMLPSVVVAPLIAGVVDRHRRERVLLVVCLARGAALAGAALSVAVLDLAPPAYALAAFATLAHTLYRPAHSALLPSLCTTPAELTSANVVRGLLDSASALLGPLAAGVLVAVLDVQGVLAGAALAAWWAAWLTARVTYEAPPRIDAVSPSSPMRDVHQSLAVVRRQPAVGVLCFLFCTQTFTRGCFSVFAVVISIELLDAGESGVGVLTAAFGLGAVFGSFVAALLIGRAGFARWFGLGIALWGLPFALLAPVSQMVLACMLLGVVGVANAVVDVTGFTLLQRMVPDSIMGRFFVAFEAALTLGVAVGAIAVPGLIALFDARGALVVAGLVAPTAVAISWLVLRRLDRTLAVEDVVLDHLQSLDMLRPLPMATIAALAAAVTDQHAAAGEVVVAQGTVGDDVFVITDGDAEVLVDDRLVAVLRPGECFGEIAALGGGIRSSTVRAKDALALHRLPGHTFVSAVTGYTPSLAEAEVLVGQRLARSSPAGQP